MKRLGSTVLLLLLCIGFTFADRAQEGRFALAGLNEREVEAFFNSFRDAVSAGDKRKVASLLNYPVSVKLASGARRTIRSRAEFIKSYDRIFDAEFRRLIVKIDVSELWAKTVGVGTPRGEIWFSGIENEKPNGSYRIRIIRINGLMRASDP